MTPLALTAIVTQAEQAGVIAAAEQLSSCLGHAAAGASWPVQLHLLAPGSPPPRPPPSAIITSLLVDVADPSEPIAKTTERWRDDLARLAAAGAPIFVMNVFRHVSGRAGDGSVSPVLERIRRLDLMAVRLSHQLGVCVVDIDRAFAHIGARTLQTDYRLGGVLAAEVAGHALAWALLSFGLDDVVDPELQEKARASLGPLSEIDALVSRRLAARRARAARSGQAG